MYLWFNYLFERITTKTELEERREREMGRETGETEKERERVRESK